jgi:hypothetical protein
VLTVIAATTRPVAAKIWGILIVLSFPPGDRAIGKILLCAALVAECAGNLGYRLVCSHPLTNANKTGSYRIGAEPATIAGPMELLMTYEKLARLNLIMFVALGACQGNGVQQADKSSGKGDTQSAGRHVNASTPVALPGPTGSLKPPMEPAAVSVDRFLEQHSRKSLTVDFEGKGIGTRIVYGSFRDTFGPDTQGVAGNLGYGVEPFGHRFGSRIQAAAVGAFAYALIQLCCIPWLAGLALKEA